MMYEYSYVNYILSHEHVEKGKVWKKAKTFPNTKCWEVTNANIAKEIFLVDLN